MAGAGASAASSSALSRLTLAKRQIQRGQHEQVDQGRSDQAAEDHYRHGVFDLVPGMLPATTSGTSARPVAKAVIMIGARRSLAP